MSKEDWIILRLLMAGVRTPATHSPDYPKAILYLRKKYGEKTLYEAIEQLRH